MFYNQPLATRFGTDLVGHIASGNWKKLDIAVAWVRASGMAHLEPVLKPFLEAGNELNVVVGIDLDNTTKEGLERLLKLHEHGTTSIFVHHNESGPIFHPKLYLFRNSTRGKLIVGSNNITAAGLFQNTEAGLELDVAVDDQIIISALDALDAWRDTKLRTARQLDTGFLEKLVSNGYVKDEATLRAQTAARRELLGSKSRSRQRLFGSVHVTLPTTTVSSKTSVPRKTSVKFDPSGASKALQKSAIPGALGQVLLMRVRKARGTQVQIPLAVLRKPFFAGISGVFSVVDGVTRGIHATHATRAKNSNPNTLKLEMPETRATADPIARFERTANGVQYEVYDSSSPKGKSILRALRAGRTASPPTTQLTLPSDPTRSTWWRFI